MLGPLVVLAVLAVGLGFIATPFAEVLGQEGETMSLPMVAASVGVALLGLTAGWIAEKNGVESDAALESKLGGVWRGAFAGWGFDALVERAIVRPSVSVARFAFAFVDRLVVDGIVEGVGGLAWRVGSLLARLQSGDAQWYSAMIGIGVVLLLIASVWMGRVGL